MRAYSPTPNDRESFPVVARLMFVRTKATRRRHAVGCAAPTIANQCSACFGDPHVASIPLRGLRVRVRVFRNRRRNARDIDAECLCCSGELSTWPEGDDDVQRSA
jgi:hypothetical protein